MLIPWVSVSLFGYWFSGCGSGIKITGYVVKSGGKNWVKLGSKSPQDPQVGRAQFFHHSSLFVAAHSFICLHMRVHHVWNTILFLGGNQSVPSAYLIFICVFNRHSIPLQIMSLLQKEIT